MLCVLCVSVVYMRLGFFYHRGAKVAETNYNSATSQNTLIAPFGLVSFANNS